MALEDRHEHAFFRLNLTKIDGTQDWNLLLWNGNSIQFMETLTWVRVSLSVELWWYPLLLRPWFDDVSGRRPQHGEIKSLCAWNKSIEKFIDTLQGIRSGIRTQGRCRIDPLAFDDDIADNWQKSDKEWIIYCNRGLSNKSTKVKAYTLLNLTSPEAV